MIDKEKLLDELIRTRISCEVMTINKQLDEEVNTGAIATIEALIEMIKKGYFDKE